MVGLMQIMIYLFCVYLVYKGFEIFQIAFVSNADNGQTLKVGVVLGVVAIVAAVIISVGAVFMTEEIISKIGNNMLNFR